LTQVDDAEDTLRVKAVVIAEAAVKVAGESQTCLTVQVKSQFNVESLL
jgi:hypothetical protein